MKGQPIVFDFNVFPNNLVVPLDVHQGDELGQLLRAAKVIMDDSVIFLPLQLQLLLDGIQRLCKELPIGCNILHQPIYGFDVVFNDLVEAVVYPWVSTALDLILVTHTCHTLRLCLYRHMGYHSLIKLPCYCQVLLTACRTWSNQKLTNGF